MSDSDHRPAEVRQQARQQADQARTAMEDQREGKAGGVSGWVAERAGEWDLSGTGRDNAAAPEVLLEPVGGLLVPDGDRRLGKYRKAAGVIGGHPLRRALCVGRLDCRPAMVAAVRFGAPPARHRSRRADGHSRRRPLLPFNGSIARGPRCHRDMCNRALARKIIVLHRGNDEQSTAKPSCKLRLRLRNRQFLQSSPRRSPHRSQFSAQASPDQWRRHRRQSAAPSWLEQSHRQGRSVPLDRMPPTALLRKRYPGRRGCQW